jgi:hypothetical protein|tara:strand:- start:368 stop:658 length:291 start_codon:yes stop_codon:yes gene_type:complete
MIEDNISFGLGQVMVSTTDNKGHDPEFWAKQITNKIVGISEQADPHIRQQAEAFKNHVYTLILLGIKNAIASDRVTIRGLLASQGHEDMAKIIKEL